MAVQGKLDIVTLREAVISYGQHLSCVSARNQMNASRNNNSFQGARPPGPARVMQVVAYEYLEDDPAFQNWFPESVCQVQPSQKHCCGCGETGHMLRDCPTRRNKLASLRPELKRQQQANVLQPSLEDIPVPAIAADTQVDEWNMLLCERSMHIATYQNQTLWLVDSGATSNLTPFGDQLSDAQSVSIPLGTADKTSGSLTATKRGTVKTKVAVDSGSIISVKLNDVLHTPNLSCPILSVFKMKEAGMHVDFATNRIVNKALGAQSPGIPIV